ncbi:HTH_Tnp_Tc3_2 domain-containing protein, partial [Trichonephila clavipes]
IVFNLWQELKVTGSVERKPGQGYSRATTTREDYHLSIIVRHNKVTTASQLSRELYAATGTRILRLAVSKRLYERGLFVRTPAVFVLFSSKNRRVRLKCCKTLRDWSMVQ